MIPNLCLIDRNKPWPCKLTIIRLFNLNTSCYRKMCNSHVSCLSKILRQRELTKKWEGGRNKNGTKHLSIRGPCTPHALHTPKEKKQNFSIFAMILEKQRLLNITIRKQLLLKCLLYMCKISNISRFVIELVFL